MMPGRRALLTGVVAAGAAATGGAWAWWRAQRFEQATAGLWDTRWPQPDGGELALARLRGRPLVLNFWATWCPPCVRELPQLDRFRRDFAPQGWQVLGLAVDQAAPVREFLRRMPLGLLVGLAGPGGIELTRRLGNDAGGLPFTVVFGRDGLPVQRKIGETSYAELAAWARNMQ
jgi:thiol-disulfide isomerase/thioredoxin